MQRHAPLMRRVERELEAQLGREPRAQEVEDAMVATISAMLAQGENEPSLAQVQNELEAHRPRPLPVPIYVGTLEVRGALIIANYQDENGVKVEVSIDPDDIKHVSVLVDSLIQT